MKGNFRQFVFDKWQEHKEELMAWEQRMPQYDADYYFQKHRWFLKNLYKLENKEVDSSSK